MMIQKKGLSSLKESKTKIISLKLAGNGDMIYIKIVKGEITWGNWQHSQMDNTLMLHLCTDCKSFFGGEFSCLKKMIYYIAFYIR